MMWIFTKVGFVSIVADENSDMLLARGRFKGDLEAIFPGSRVQETRDADYRFRTRIDRDTAGTVIADMVRSIDYPNFKNECADNRHALMLAIWGRMMDEQRRRTPPKIERRKLRDKKALRRYEKVARIQRSYDEVFGLPPLPDEDELPWPARGA